MAKTLAWQFGAAEVEKACTPFQFVLSTRAWTDCVGHAIRAITDANPRASVLSIDGIGAYDHVLRFAMHSSRGWFLLSNPSSTHFRHVMRGKMSTVPVERWRSTREANRKTPLYLICSASQCTTPCAK